MAQTRTSISIERPVSRIMEVGLIEAILVETNSTLPSTRASRYPGPGVRRLHPTAKEGVRASTISGFLASRSFISARKA